MALVRTAALLGLALAAAVPARAQDRPSGAAVTVTSADDDSCRVQIFTHRGRLGLLVQSARSPDTDSIGALIQGVTRGGPAEKAGIQKGDVVTRFNGERLAGARADDGDRSGPGLRLVELARRLEPGDTARLEVRRGRETRTATLVAERMAAVAFRHGPEGLREFGMDFPMPDLEWMRQLPRRVEFSLPFRTRSLGLELVPLNRDLGAYFGTEEGVLVVRVEKESPLGLKAGDVILSIGGRTPTSPGHALRILRSYDPGEKVRLEIMRQRRKTTAEATIPERPAPGWLAPEPPEPPDEP